MSDLLTEFERDCAVQNIAPTAALHAGGVHKSLWWKWKAGKVSPTLTNFEKARSGLKRLEEARASDNAHEAAA